MNIKIGLKDIIYSILIILIVFSFDKNLFKTKNEIENRLKEVCFLYNDSCNEELGGCTCISKASQNDVDFILKK